MPPALPGLLLALLPALGAVVAFAVLRRRSPTVRDEELGALAAERRVVEWLEPLEREGFRVFHDLHLPRADGTGTTHLDHVVVGESGVLLIETRPANGPVRGCRYDRSWTRTVGGREECFPNPMFEVARRVEALSQWLRLPASCVRGAVFLVGRPERQKDAPDNVVTERHAAWIRAQRGDELMPVEVLRVSDELERLYRQKLTLLQGLRLRGAEEAATAGDYLSLGVVRASETPGLNV